MTLIIMISMINNMWMMMSLSPVMMSILVVSQTMLAVLMISLQSMISWMSFITFLIMVGGLMILFMYITSMMPNPQSKVMMKITYLLTVAPILMMTFITNQFNFMPPSFNNYNVIITKILSTSSMTSIYATMMYLFMILFVISSMTSFNQTPMRTSNIYDKIK